MSKEQRHFLNHEIHGIHERGKMSEGQETIEDIIAWLRRPREGENAYLTLWRDEIADRLKAALRREKAAIEADALAVGGMVEAAYKREHKEKAAEAQSRHAAIGESPRSVKTTDIIPQYAPVSNCAKLREALKKCLLYIACAESVGVGTITLNDKVNLNPKKIIKLAKKALAATEQEGGAK